MRAGPDPNHGYGVLYNAMIAPFALGPMSLSSMIWFQGSWPARRAKARPRGALAPARTHARSLAHVRTHSRVR